MRKYITYFFLVVSSLIVVAAFITATSYVQLIAASIAYPILVYLILKAFPRRIALVPINTTLAGVGTTQIGLGQASQTTTPEEIDQPATQTIPTPAVADNNKRDFLKMIGAAGLSFFLFQLFNRRASIFGGSTALPFGSTKLEDAQGQKINPATSQPTDSYRISEIDDGIVSYYGLINNSGGWFIMQEDIEGGTFRYAKGERDFPGNWSNRENLQYDYFYNVF